MERQLSITELESTLQTAMEEWVRLDAERQLLKQQLAEKNNALSEYEKTKDVYEKVRVLLQQSAEYAREHAKEQIEQLVTNALQYIISPFLQFQIEIDEQGNKAVAEFYVISNFEGVKVKTKPQEARGGGVVDIVTLALRIALIETIRPKLDGPIILDEPGKHVSGEYAFFLYEFLKSLSDMFSRQIILVTHNHHLAESGDKVFFVEMKDGRSTVKTTYNA